ncbi:site-specific integrase [Neptuniibacter sp. QD37_11]|uniref:site-specific integrase n=1 Tax=Neptuniibacter sp. QD37_11 TaxID=3398209 RepID=UPI0039F5A484
MTNKALNTVSPPSSNLVITQSGYEIDSASNRWVLDKDITITLGAIDAMDGNSSEFLRRAFVEFSRVYTPHTVRGHFTAARSFAKSHHSLNCTNFFEWVESKPSKAYPQLLKFIILFGHSFGLKGIDDDLINALLDHELGSKRPSCLPHVETQDPVKGPYSDLELQNIMAKSLFAYTDGKISLKAFTALMLCAQTGRRPIQLSDLKVKDLVESRTNDDIPAYAINFPRRKQRNQAFRKTFNKCQIDQDLWRVLQLWVSHVVAHIQKAIGDIDEVLLSEFPIFPNPAFMRTKSLQSLLEYLHGDKFHNRSNTISSLITSVGRTLDITSERTGQSLEVTPYRFRHTIGTNSAREGYGATVIAEILDHTTDVVAGSYTANTPDIVERLDKAIALQLAPLAQAFAGVIIKDESEAERGDDPTSRISDGEAAVGSCGSYGFCSAAAPIACYTCKKFQPWLEAQHEAVLEHLLEERARLLNVTGDSRIASVNDRVIVAVTEVILKCKTQKQKALIEVKHV